MSRISAEERFWSKVNKGDDDDCWEWTASIRGYGYGEFYDRGRIGAHRWIYKHLHGEIPSGLCVLHRCDNPRCVNPNHLFLGTQIDNMEDMQRKGRNKKGEQHGRSNLTRADVIKIRKSVAEGQSRKWLAEVYNVSYREVCRVVSGERWNHLPVEINQPKLNPVRLNPEEVKEIRKLYASGEWTHKELACIYGVTKRTIGRAIDGTSWKNIE